LREFLGEGGDGTTMLKFFSDMRVIWHSFPNGDTELEGTGMKSKEHEADRHRDLRETRCWKV